ncbi:MAG: hypothetical protein HY744_17450 [Deltaproteobacteria bacterium]|nr:hypothetical protein [Deltaproteobacteria bacterium]
MDSAPPAQAYRRSDGEDTGNGGASRRHLPLPEQKRDVRLQRSTRQAEEDAEGVVHLAVADRQEPPQVVLRPRRLAKASG